MNDRQQPYGQNHGYDAYGRPLHQPTQDPADEHTGAGYSDPTGPAAPPAGGYQDGYGGYGYQQGYAGDQGGYPGWDGYGGDTGQQTPVPSAPGYDGAYAAQAGYAGYYAPTVDHDTGQQPPVPDPYGYDTGQQAPVADTFGYDTGQQRPVADGYGYQPGQPAPVAGAFGSDTGQQAPVVDAFNPDTGQQPPVPPAEERAAPTVPGPRRPAPDEQYETEQFAFVEEQDEESEDVIDWLKFSESRTERREEAKRRGRSRRRLLVITLVLALLGGVGFLWSTDRLPFLGGEDAAPGPGAEARDVIVVHLWPLDSEETATALLVANETAGAGTTLLLPNELAVSPDGGTTTLGQAVMEESAGSVREALSSLLGADIKGTWRLNVPSLVSLVDLVSGITVTTDVEVPGAEEEAEPLVPAGEDVQLRGEAAAAYATYRAPDEPQSAQLARFGQVLQAVLDTLSTNQSTVDTTVEALRQIHDPSLSQQELSASLATLAGYAQSDAYQTTPLPVDEDGTVSDETADGLVNDVLGGSISNAEPGGTVRLGIRDATGTDAMGEMARISLVNGGMTVVDSRSAGETAETTSILYEVPEHREAAVEAARTLGLTEDVVTEGDGPGTADVTIVLGADYAP
ncbi:LytR C-terminal domain-containing protein [Streptomyces sp. DSM 44915]|uniref:LytR C-terminal domain-containing protein n=1 Tax=Streptomyces chisholmiae TaxID=3075540 RepID=A0ABU2K0C4_9ACTN|nr:LytR C-terminal domain-containing protein [Streptomyces sp. DSM 44915]MDT0270662.1 LytR C-terminal domain-containing protein [Streptomyces sp. DSM 44915]